MEYAYMINRMAGRVIIINMHESLVFMHVRETMSGFEKSVKEKSKPPRIYEETWRKLSGAYLETKPTSKAFKTKAFEN